MTRAMPPEGLPASAPAKGLVRITTDLKYLMLHCKASNPICNLVSMMKHTRTS
jgi:hypothetical protein